MSGKIFLVGFGPGAEEHMTYRAKQAIAESDVVIGYSTYIKLVKDLLDGKEVVKKGMTEEIDRCIEAYEQAKQGKKVSLISSGDIGVYGMAGPTYEVLFQAGWTPESEISVETIPGSTALSACASLVGAPLTHDFCSISLSDLLTPWPTISGRLNAAAKADFVTALYNPKSGRRTQQIVAAQEIFLKYRDPATPVAIVKSAYRRRQAIQLVRLDEMAEQDIGMLTTVLIGNSTTYIEQGLMITPRGYSNKYDTISGEAKQGEKAGRSLTMGLEGWKNCVSEYLVQHPELSFEKIADYFNVSLADILSALAETPTAQGRSHHAFEIATDKLNHAITTTENWGRLRGVVRTDSGAVVELFLHGKDFNQKTSWLNIENDAFHLHINWDKVSRGYFASRTNSSYGLHFVDQHGQLVFRLLLTKQAGEFNPALLALFQQDRLALCLSHTQEDQND